MGAWLFFFYAADEPDADIARRMPVWVVGLVLTAASIIETFDDPLIGYWSDRTRSRWGRRIPFILLAAPPWALFFVLLWTPPAGGESIANAVYLFFILQLFHAFGTLSGSPYEALLPELAPRNNERVRIVTVQVVFGAVAAIMALVLAGPLIDAFGFVALGLITAGLALASRYLGLASIWRHARRDVPPADLKIREGFKLTFRNPQFVAFLPSFVLFNMGITLMTATLPFYVEEVVEAEEGRVGTYSSLLAAVPIAVMLLSLPFVYRAATRLGKAWIYRRAMVLGGLYLPLLFFMGFIPGIPALVQGLVLLAPVGLCMSAVFVLPNAFLADIADHDALQTGMRREGMYYGTQNVVEGIVESLYAAVLAGLLVLGGTSDNPIGIRLVGPIAGLAILCAGLWFKRYTLPDDVGVHTAAPRPSPEPAPAAG
jgi:GPH family glycoside/pentoside/hexuronide:cation symporter